MSEANIYFQYIFSREKSLNFKYKFKSYYFIR